MLLFIQFYYETIYVAFDVRTQIIPAHCKTSNLLYCVHFIGMTVYFTVCQYTKRLYEYCSPTKIDVFTNIIQSHNFMYLYLVVLIWNYSEFLKIIFLAMKSLSLASLLFLKDPVPSFLPEQDSKDFYSDKQQFFFTHRMCCRLYWSVCKILVVNSLRAIRLFFVSVSMTSCERIA